MKEMTDYKLTDEELQPPLLGADGFDASAEDSLPWYAIKLYTPRLKAVKQAFTDVKMSTFVPMQMTDFADSAGHIHHELRPVVRNLIFLKKTEEEAEIRRFITSLNYKMAVVTKSATDRAYYEIPAKQMFEFQAMCNPDILMRKFITSEQAKLKAGTPVMVKYGPLKGLTGKLVRSNKKYYLLKEVPCLGVMLKVSRWCCVPLDISGQQGCE